MSIKRKRSFADPCLTTSFEDLKSKETREVKSRRMDEEETVNRLNDLPEDIILKIMSSIPTMEVVGTCILSKRWKDVFASVSDIDLGGYDFLKNRTIRKSFMNFVSGFLSSRKDISVNRFRLFCRGPGMSPRRINEWILYALEHDVRELDLRIETRDFNALPFDIFTCQTLETLRLYMLPNFVLRVPSNCCLLNLKVLCLSLLKFSDDESVRMLLSSCNSLEELVIESCELCNVNKLSICYPKLKRLTIKGRTCSAYKLELNTPNLVYLEYFYSEATRHSFINLDSLSEAHIGIGFDISSKDRNGPAPAIDLMRGISHVRSLHLTGCFLDMQALLLCPGLIPKFPKLAHLTMGGCYPGWGNMLDNCPNLETLAFDFWGCGVAVWDEPKKVPSCLVHHVKAIKLIAFKGNKVEFQLVKYLLKKAKVLERLTVELEIHATKRKKRMTAKKMVEKICALPKVSKQCKIHITIL